MRAPRAGRDGCEGALNELAHTIDPRVLGADCDHCPLKDKTPVPSEGPLDAEIAFVGEMPSWSEERAGRPYAGASGRMLEALLAQHDIKRESVYVSNATLCKPLEVRIGADTDVDKKSQALAMKCCAPRLANELAQLKRLRVVVPQGAVAARSIIGKRSLRILRIRGYVWDVDSKVLPRRDPPVHVIPTVNPAFVMRAPAWTPVMQTDFDRAIRALRGELRMLDAHLAVLAPPVDSIKAELARLGPVVAVDVETTKETATSSRLLCIGMSDGAHTVVIPFASTHSPDERWYGDRQGGVCILIRDALRARTSITHSTYDRIVLRRYGIRILPSKWEDTLVAHHTFAAHLPQRLEHVAPMYIDFKPWKMTSKRPGSSDDDKGAWNPEKLTDVELHSYNAEDCVVEHDVWTAMQPDLKSEFHVYEKDKRLADFCIGMQEHGVWVDKDYRKEVRSELEAKKCYYMDKIDALGEVKIRSCWNAHDVRVVLFEHFGAPILERTITGLPKTDAKVLQGLAQMDTVAGKFCRYLIRMREADKERSTYVDGPLIERDGRVHPSWRGYGTESGRFSCAAPNLQNLKRGDVIRHMYAAPPGRLLVSFDYSQLEMRIAAHLSGDPALIAACESSDMHAVNAGVLFGVLPDKAIHPKEFKILRDAGKEAGFAMNYLAGVETVHGRMVAKGLKATVRAIEVALQRLRRVYAGYFRWQEALLEQVAHDGYLRLHLSGRFCWFGREPKASDVANRPIQGGAADVVNEIMPEIDAALPSDSFFVAQVHDQGIVETEAWRAEAIGVLCKKIAEQEIDVCGKKVRFPVEVKIGQRWE